jgi:Na+/H+-dicarboxylate symporters
MKETRKLFPIILIGVISVTLVMFFLRAYKILDISNIVLLVFRFLSLGMLVIYAFKKRSLTTWILVCMLAGAEFGYDIPVVARKLQFLSDIFLRLIKTIIAPLLFSTLVVWIAGHANIKQIGRMGWKSLIL